jgi:hypothetical protein
MAGARLGQDRSPALPNRAPRPIWTSVKPRGTARRLETGSVHTCADQGRPVADMPGTSRKTRADGGSWRHVRPTSTTSVKTAANARSRPPERWIAGAAREVSIVTAGKRRAAPRQARRWGAAGRGLAALFSRLDEPRSFPMSPFTVPSVNPPALVRACGLGNGDDGNSRRSDAEERHPHDYASAVLSRCLECLDGGEDQQR